MRGAKHFLTGRQCPLIERFRFPVAPLGVIYSREVVDTLQGIRGFGAEHFLTGRQRPLKERFRFPVAPLGFI